MPHPLPVYTQRASFLPGTGQTLPAVTNPALATYQVIKQGKVSVVRNIDVAPTVLAILGVAPAETVDGETLEKILQPSPGHE